jgi:hypothetical protein
MRQKKRSVCTGNADYRPLLGNPHNPDDITCRVVIVVARETVDGNAQLLAYIAMAQPDKRKRGYTNVSVYSAVSDETQLHVLSFGRTLPAHPYEPNSRRDG